MSTDRIKYGVIQGETLDNIVKTASDEIVEQISVEPPSDALEDVSVKKENIDES
tara:strand:- start:1623 stop:1784 length:162 start_codon:yes stop_codon:yes gene_type:complete